MEGTTTRSLPKLSSVMCLVSRSAAHHLLGLLSVVAMNADVVVLPDFGALSQMGKTFITQILGSIQIL